MTGREPTDDTLQNKLQYGDYQITLVPGQSAISTDFDVSIVVNFFDNPFVRTPFRHNVWNSRCKLLNMILCPERDYEAAKSSNWDFLCDVLRKQNWFTDVKQKLEATASSFALCASSIESHNAFYDTCVQPFVQKWERYHWSMPREEFHGHIRHWINEQQVTPPEQVSCT